jgi:apolipoprotein D and lipocalin family protein
MRRIFLIPIGSIMTLASLFGCSSNPPIPPVAHVEVSRFMGPWYVIASIPSRFDRDAYNAVESYALLPDGRIQTTFRYREGGFDGKVKTMHPVGTVNPGTGNAVWGMQFIWPIQAEYVIADLDPEYSTTIVARTKRDYVWIMARSPEIPAAQYESLTAKVAALGYDARKLVKVPQQWPEKTNQGNGGS